jgi:hypothetical protein
MTVISTHRFHTYKSTATIQKRSVSPKKIRQPTKNIHISSSNPNQHSTTPNVLDVCKEFNSLYSYIYDLISNNKVVNKVENEEANESIEVTDEELYEEMWAYYDRLEDAYDV